ncbi:hypothetical protein C460_05606 [Haloferax sp. ATCC BAA-646]|nr:hypothetical protein [Haloferax sp. ATCC BAA-646]ELZ59857.1 hypothetical protein C460_05606 [Haloferax sp. ATCC BAA-646]
MMTNTMPKARTMPSWTKFARSTETYFSRPTAVSVDSEVEPPPPRPTASSAMP